MKDIIDKNLGAAVCDNCNKPIITFPGMKYPAGIKTVLETGETFNICYLCLVEIGEKGENFKPKGKKLKKLWK